MSQEGQKLKSRSQKFQDEALKESLCKKIDDKVKCVIVDPHEKVNEGYFTYTQDKRLQSCMSKELNVRSYKILSFEMFQALALTLLNHDLPFVCVNEIQYKSGVRGPHALVFLGYKYSPTAVGKITFLARDSNRRSLNWVQGGCAQVIAIAQGAEKLPEFK